MSALVPALLQPDEEKGKSMKITKIALGCRRTNSVYGERYQECCVCLFRSPVIFDFGGTEKKCSGLTIILYTPGKRQYFRPEEGGTLKYDMVLFRPSSADKQYAAGMNIPFDVPMNIKDDYLISSILKNMKVCFGLDGRRKSEFMELSMRMILICVADQNDYGKSVKEEINVPKYPQLKALRDDIYDDPMRSWSIDEMCAELGVSRTYFHRIYLAAFGVTCRQDVIESRLAYAEELLSETDLSVSAIAEQCGYESDSYFMRQFKQHRGYTPTDYRRKVEMQIANELKDADNGEDI